MKKITISTQKQSQLIKDIQNFALTETNMKLSEAQATSIIKLILSNLESSIYDQISFEIRSSIKQEVEQILGIEKVPIQ